MTSAASRRYWAGPLAMWSILTPLANISAALALLWLFGARNALQQAIWEDSSSAASRGERRILHLANISAGIATVVCLVGAAAVTLWALWR